MKNIQTDNTNDPHLLATYDLERKGYMVDKERTNFALLTNMTRTYAITLWLNGATLRV